MPLASDQKKAIFTQYAFSKKTSDTGSPESQIALFTNRIKSLTGHLQTRRKDKVTEYGLKKLVGKRSKLLKYLERNDISRYRAIKSELGIR